MSEIYQVLTDAIGRDDSGTVIFFMATGHIAVTESHLNLSMNCDSTECFLYISSRLGRNLNDPKLHDELTQYDSHKILHYLFTKYNVVITNDIIEHALSQVSHETIAILNKFGCKKNSNAFLYLDDKYSCFRYLVDNKWPIDKTTINRLIRKNRPKEILYLVLHRRKDITSEMMAEISEFVSC